MQTLATLGPILKEVCQDGVNDQLNGERRALNRIKKTDRGLKDYGGKYVRFTAHVGRNNGLGARKELEPLPKAGRQRFVEGHIDMAFLYASVSITGQTIALADTNKQAFANNLTEEMSRVKDDISADENKMFFGDGLGGRTNATGIAVGQVIPVNDARMLDMYGAYDVHTPGNPVKKTTVEVEMVEYAATGHKVTVSGTVTAIAAGDIFVRLGSYGREWHGIGSILSDTTKLHNIDPALEPLWRAEVRALTPNTPISENVMLEMQDAIYRNGGKTTVMWTTLGLIRAYFQLLVQERKFVNSKDFDGGFTGVGFFSPNGGEIPLLADIDAPRGQISYLNEKVMDRYDATKGYQLMNRTGSIWRQIRQGDDDLDAFQATLQHYGEMGTTRRNTHGKITGLKDDS